jgi:hypothetical protein
MPHDCQRNQCKECLRGSARNAADRRCASMTDKEPVQGVPGVEHMPPQAHQEHVQGAQGIESILALRSPLCTSYGSPSAAALVQYAHCTGLCAAARAPSAVCNSNQTFRLPLLQSRPGSARCGAAGLFLRRPWPATGGCARESGWRSRAAPRRASVARPTSKQHQVMSSPQQRLCERLLWPWLPRPQPSPLRCAAPDGPCSRVRARGCRLGAWRPQGSSR